MQDLLPRLCDLHRRGVLYVDVVVRIGKYRYM